MESVVAEIKPEHGEFDDGEAAGASSPPPDENDKDDPNSKKGNARKRTKTGCLTCRKRRIKCDEGRPICNNCIKSKRHCEGYNQRVIFKNPIGFPTPFLAFDEQEQHQQHQQQQAAAAAAAAAAVGAGAAGGGQLGNGKGTASSAPGPLPIAPKPHRLEFHHPLAAAQFQPHFHQYQPPGTIGLVPLGAGLGGPPPPPPPSMGPGLHEPVTFPPGPSSSSHAHHSAGPGAAPPTPLSAGGPRSGTFPPPLSPSDGNVGGVGVGGPVGNPSLPHDAAAAATLISPPLRQQERGWENTTVFNFQTSPISPAERFGSVAGGTGGGVGGGLQNRQNSLPQQQQQPRIRQRASQALVSPVEEDAPLLTVVAAGAGHPSQHQQQQQQQQYTGEDDSDYRFSDEDASMDDSDDEIFPRQSQQQQQQQVQQQGGGWNNHHHHHHHHHHGRNNGHHGGHGTVVTAAAAAAAAAQRGRSFVTDVLGTGLRTFSTFADDNILALYDATPYNSPLNDPLTAAIFSHFVNVTGPSMSLYERHPFDPTQMYQGEPIPKSRQHIWTYTFPIISFNHPALLQAILALGSLQIAKLDGVPPTAALKHYHLALRRIARNVRTPARRTQPATLAATLLLAYFEVWSSDHEKWCKHLFGARIIMREVPFLEMTRQMTALKRERRAREREQQQQMRHHHASMMMGRAGAHQFAGFDADDVVVDMYDAADDAGARGFAADDDAFHDGGGPPYYPQQPPLDENELDVALLSQLSGHDVDYSERPADSAVVDEDSDDDLNDDPDTSRRRRRQQQQQQRTRPAPPKRYTERDMETYEHLADLYWWYGKMDVYQSILGGTRLLMDYSLWTQCPPRAPMGRLDAIYGTYDHLMLLLARLASFASKDLPRKRKVMRSGGPPGMGGGGGPPPGTGGPPGGMGGGPPGMGGGGPPGAAPPPGFGMQGGPVGGPGGFGGPPPPPGVHMGMGGMGMGGMGMGGPPGGGGGPGQTSPPMFAGMLPTSGRVEAPMGFSPERESTPASDATEDIDVESATLSALREWASISAAFEALRLRFGPEFEPLDADVYAARIETPFGAPALQYRTYSIAGIWMNYYMGLIVLQRAHPSMPPVAMMAAGRAAQSTAEYAHRIGRIASGISEDCAQATKVSTLMAAALLECCFCLFVAAVQFRDISQRHWTIRRLHDINRLTGWQSARQIADGCESAWTKAAQLGRGPPYARPADVEAQRPKSVWDNPRRIDQRISELEGDEASGGGKVVLAQEQQAYYALGLLGVEQDLDKLELHEGMEFQRGVQQQQQQQQQQVQGQGQGED